MKTICIDFDGVLHSYTSGWQGEAVASDPPVPGAIEWLRSLIADPDMEPMIYSSRSRQEGGIACMRAWLLEHGMTTPEIDALQFPTQKPAAFLTVDDRAICFNGNFPSLTTMKEFKPWNKREAPDSLDAILSAPRTFVRVYELPTKLTDGFCHGGGRPIAFVNVDWFEAIVASGPEHLIRFIKGKQYYKPHRSYVVIGDHPDFTFRISPDPMAVSGGPKAKAQP